MMDDEIIVDRHLEPVVAQRLTEEPVVVLTGARTVGKSTLLASCARAHHVPVVDLDDLDTRRALTADPALYMAAGNEPICIDEFQHTPIVLDAIKAELNRDFRPGRYLLTGSTRYSTLPKASQSLTGRAHIMTMWPFSQGELIGRKETFLDILVSDPQQLVSAELSTTSRAQYEQLILAGGFPIALSRTSSEGRRRWFRDFIHLVIERDVLEIRKIRQRQLMPAVLQHLAAQTAQLLNCNRIAEQVQLEPKLTGDFISLLEAVFLIHRLEAFDRKWSGRIGRSPKVHILDSGLAAHLLNLTARKLDSRMPSALLEFGYVVKTFAVNELAKQAGWAGHAVQFFHFRTRDQHEVDLVIETDEGLVAGVEVKASSTISDNDFRGLRFLRDKLGDEFVGGVLLNLGQRSYRYEDRLYVMPLDRLWA